MATCEAKDCTSNAADGERFCTACFEDLKLHLALLDFICTKCGKHAPEGFLLHDCENPGPQPPSREVLFK